jgi:hypothetical protein
MKRNRERLENEILNIAQDFNSKIKISVSKFIQNRYKIFFGKTLSYFNFSAQLEEATEKEMYYIALGINEYFEKNLIDIDKFYTDLEIKEYNNNKFTSAYKKNIENDVCEITLPYVSMNNEQHFIAPVVSYETIVNILHNGLITYNFNTQREPKYFKFEDKILKKPFLNKKSVKEITDLMIKGEFFSNTISFNVRYISGVENIVYDRANKVIKLDIKNNTYFDIVDGYHRLISLSKAYANGINSNMTINIFHHTEEKIRKFIIQESKQNQINEEHLLKLNNNDPWVGLARAINDYGNKSVNTLYNKILNDDSEIQFKKFVKYLKETFEYNYKKPEDAIKIKKFIVDGFNEIEYYNLFDEVDAEEKYKESLQLLSQYYKNDKNVVLEFRKLLTEQDE